MSANQTITGISAVIPVYNSERSLRGVVERLEKVLRGLDENFEIVLVNDGSRDRSWETVCELARQKSWVRGIRLIRNFGQHNALLCGIRACRYSVIVTLDDDGQNPPEEIPKLIHMLHEGYDLVFGVPESRQEALWRSLSSRLTKTAMYLVLGTEAARHVSPFRAFYARLRDAFTDFNGAFVPIDVLLTWGTNQLGSVRVKHDPRRIGRSNYSFGRMVVHALNLITGFSILPLQFASIVGFSFTLFGVAVLAYVLVSYFVRGTSVAGFPFLASIIAIFSGAQLFTLGIIGEYLARIHITSMKRPAYVIAEELAPAPARGSECAPVEEPITCAKAA